MPKRKQRKRELSVPDRHQLRIALDSLKMPDAMLGVMGGPSKAEARVIVKRLTGKTPRENPVYLEAGRGGKRGQQGFGIGFGYRRRENPGERITARDVNATKNINGYWVLSTIKDGQRVQNVYGGYSKADAMREFLRAVNGPKKNAPKKARKTARRSRLIKKMGFFKSHTMRVGHTAQDALALAKAEQEANRRGWTYEYHPEQERYEDVYGEKDPGGEWVTVVLKDKWGNVLASLGFVDERDSNYLRGVRAQLAEEALSDPNVRAVKPRSKNPKNVRVRARKRVRVLRRKRNPAIGILGNPPHDGKYLGKVTYIEYTHGHDGQKYYHEFSPAVYAQVTDDGGVRLWHPTNKLWKLFPEPK